MAKFPILTVPEFPSAIAALDVSGAQWSVRDAPAGFYADRANSLSALLVDLVRGHPASTGKLLCVAANEVSDQLVLDAASSERRYPHTTLVTCLERSLECYALGRALIAHSGSPLDRRFRAVGLAHAAQACFALAGLRQVQGYMAQGVGLLETAVRLSEEDTRMVFTEELDLRRHQLAQLVRAEGYRPRDRGRSDSEDTDSLLLLEAEGLLCAVEEEPEGDPKDALDAFARAVDAQPDNATAWAGLARSCALAGRWNETLACADKVLSLDSTAWLAVLLRDRAMLMTTSRARGSTDGAEAP
ncbi:MAG: tetratricopeptide repeat protein [Acidimicrobiales bacterium]